MAAMVVTALKIVVFALGWWLGRAALRAGERAGALEGRHARTILHAALALVVALYWFPEFAWTVENWRTVLGWIGILALTSIPVAGFVLFLRWAHRRAGKREDG